MPEPRTAESWVETLRLAFPHASCKSCEKMRADIVSVLRAYARQVGEAVREQAARTAFEFGEAIRALPVETP